MRTKPLLKPVVGRDYEQYSCYRQTPNLKIFRKVVTEFTVSLSLYRVRLEQD